MKLRIYRSTDNELQGCHGAHCPTARGRTTPQTLRGKLKAAVSGEQVLGNEAGFESTMRPSQPKVGESLRLEFGAKLVLTTRQRRDTV